MPMPRKESVTAPFLPEVAPTYLRAARGAVGTRVEVERGAQPFERAPCQGRWQPVEHAPPRNKAPALAKRARAAHVGAAAVAFDTLNR